MLNVLYRGAKTDPCLEKEVETRIGRVDNVHDIERSVKLLNSRGIPISRYVLWHRSIGSVAHIPSLSMPFAGGL